MGLLGIKFPFGIGPNGLPSSSEEDLLISDSIKRIVMTGRGERMMRPASGSRVAKMLFENQTPALGARISEEVKNSLRAQEKRIQVVSVKASFEGEGLIVINVIYKRVGILRRARVEINRDSAAVQ